MGAINLTATPKVIKLQEHIWHQVFTSYLEQIRQRFIFCQSKAAALPLLSLKNAVLPHFKRF